jgi:hypothetical protein
MLYRAMHFALHRHTNMAIKMACNGSTLFVIVDVVGVVQA